MNRYERLNALLDTLAERGSIEVEAIAEELAVSAATIRRDLDHLDQQQLLTRTRGGAVLHSVAYDLPLRYKQSRHTTEKQRIAASAAELVERGMVVGLNGGTTTTEVARALIARPELSQPSNTPALTVVTNALNIANELVVRQQVKLFVTGGVARPQSYELIGPVAADTLEDVTLDIAFLGVNAIDPERGVFAQDEGEASINRLLATTAQHVVVVADASKFNAHGFARICRPDEINTVITDAGSPAEEVAALEAKGLRVRRV